jgi:hypothetical protein
MLARSRFILVFGGAACAGSFFLTLWLTEPIPRPGVLSLDSQDKSSVAWSEGEAGITDGATVAPDGESTAVQFVESTTPNVYHSINQTISKPGSSISYTLTIYVKGNGRDILLRLNAGNNGAVYGVNLKDGRTLQSGTYGTGFAQGALSAEAATQGFWQLTMTVTTDTATNLTFQMASLIPETQTSVYTGNGKSGFYWWGAKLKRAPS